jgi:hypothetical protein
MANPERLREIIESAIVDAYDEYEQMGGWQVIFDEAVRLPIQATALGKAVQVLQFDADEDRGIRSLIDGSGIKQRWVGIDTLDAESLPEPLQEVLAAYQAWREGDY